MSDEIGQNLTNKPSDDLRATARKNTREDKARSESQSVLNLAALNGAKKTVIQAALEKINANQSVFAEQLTEQNLKQFQRAAANLQEEFKRKKLLGGITAQLIISHSSRKDIKRAQDEIHTIQAVKFEKDGTIQFRTNASRKYGATHHIVSVQFLNFQAALNSGNLTNKMLDAYMKSPVKFDCSCGRHRYWYRYIATVGGFAYGRHETAFPKIRNPELTGMACKHVIRVMHTLARNPVALRGAIKTHIQRFQQNPNATAKTLTKKQADKAKIVAKKGNVIRRSFLQMVHDVSSSANEKRAKMSSRENVLAEQKLVDLLNIGVISQDEYQLFLSRLKIK